MERLLMNVKSVGRSLALSETGTWVAVAKLMKNSEVGRRYSLLMEDKPLELSTDLRTAHGQLVTRLTGFFEECDAMIEFIRLLESHKLIDTATVEKVVRRKSQLMAQVENVVRRVQAMDLTGLNQVSDLVNHVSVWLDAIHLTDDLEETRRVEYLLERAHALIYYVELS